jgi:hypothetical protein
VSDVTRILTALEQGDPQAADKLLTLVYEELRKLAASRMANEAAAQLQKVAARLGWKTHLDSRQFRHHDACMRTTVTLDEDVARLVRDAMHRSRRGFKETLNAAVRNGLKPRPYPDKRVAFLVKPKPMGLRQGIDPASLNQLVDELEADAFSAFSRAARTRRTK